MKVKQSKFESVASQFASVSHAAIHTVCKRLARGDNVKGGLDWHCHTAGWSVGSLPGSQIFLLTLQ